jgi:hypothetical protein
VVWQGISGRPADPYADSPFPDKLRRPTVDTALVRNHFVAALAETILVPYAAPSSKTFELCRLLVSWKKQIYTLANHANTPLIDLGCQSIGTDHGFGNAQFTHLNC